MTGQSVARRAKEEQKRMRRFVFLGLPLVTAVLFANSFATQKKAHPSARLTGVAMESPDPEKIRAHVNSCPAICLKGAAPASAAATSPPNTSPPNLSWTA